MAGLGKLAGATQRPAPEVPSPPPLKTPMKTGIFLLLALLAPAAAPAAAPRTSAARPDTVPLPPGPAVDHHQHLFSPSLIGYLRQRSDLPTVELPAGLAALVEERGRAGADSTRLAALYADSAWLLQAWRPEWVRGGGAVAGWWARSTRSPVRLTPVEFSVDGTAGYVHAYLTAGSGDSISHPGRVMIAVRQGADSRWKIASEVLALPRDPQLAPLTADRLVELLDAAGIRRGVVLSTAYLFGSPSYPAPADELARVRAENDWIVAQAARYPDRLVAFCSFNPTRDYAVEELDRCSRLRGMRGIKLHFGNSRVNLHDAAQVERVRRVFRAANEHRLPLVVHLRTGGGGPYGRAEAQIFLDSIVTAAPDVVVQVAHLGGSGPGYQDPPSDEALAAFADAFAARHPATRNLWFDVASIVNHDIPPERAALLVTRLRRIGLGRILYGTDSAFGGNLPPRQSWAAFRSLLPLTEAEVRTVATNVAPYLR